MTGYIVNELYTTPCAENIWSWCGVKLGPRCGAVVFLKRYFCVLNTA